LLTNKQPEKQTSTDQSGTPDESGGNKMHS